MPVTDKLIDVVDRVSGAASYDTDTQLLTVHAVSSDTVGARTLTVTGFGPLTSGTFVSDKLDAPPVSITVKSDANGSVVVPVEISGAARAPIPVVAQAGPDQTVSAGQLVTLDGSASVGAQTFAWTSPAGIALSDPTTAKPTFTFPLYKYPANNGPLVFTVHVTSPNGSSSDARVTVTPAADVLAITAARYTTSKREWHIDGTSSLLAGQTVTVQLGGLNGQTLGTAVVDPTGAFSRCGSPRPWWAGPGKP